MSWLLDAFELFMLNVSCNSHCFLALCCALHRITSRVIHRTELYFFVCICIYSIHIQWQTTMICWMERFKTSHNFSREILWLAIYIMVRHNHHTYTIYIYVRSCEVKFCFMIDEINHRTVMIHTQVHLRIPCYDFYFL